jgi:hypothetical protein
MGFVLTRALAMWAGLRYLSGELTWLNQLLDLDILKHHLLRGLFHLHAQPPLYNALIGVAEKIAGARAGDLLLGLQLLLALGAVIAAYLTLVLLGVAPAFSLTIGFLLLLNPAQLLYEFDALYTAIVFSLHCFIALSLACYLKGRSGSSLYWLIGLSVCLTLVRAPYQWIWVVMLLAVLWWQLPESRRQIGSAGAVGLFIALLWPAKNFVLFHQFASTTWGSYSMSGHWNRDGSFIKEKMGEGLLPTLQILTTDMYSDSFRVWLQERWPVAPTGAPELDDLVKATGGTYNWNSLSMLRMHAAQQKDVAYLLRHDPGPYFRYVPIAILLYFRPSAEYFTLFSGPLLQPSLDQYQRLAPIDRIVSRVCCHIFGFPQLPSDTGPPPYSTAKVVVYRIKSLCMSAVLCYALIFACALSFVLRPAMWLASRDRKVAAMMMICTIFYLFAVVNLVEVGENMRFRFEVHGLAMMVAAIFLQQIYDLRRPSAQSASVGRQQTVQVR